MAADRPLFCPVCGYTMCCNAFNEGFYWGDCPGCLYCGKVRGHTCVNVNNGCKCETLHYRKYIIEIDGIKVDLKTKVDYVQYIIINNLWRC
jgi:hypothetical protein